MKLKLPKPPSVNQIYGYTSRGKFARSYITKRGKEFFTEAIKAIKEQQDITDSIEYPLIAHVDLYTSRGQDLDNILKPVFDSLGNICTICEVKFSTKKPCKCGKRLSVIHNDSQIKKIIAEFHKIKGKENQRVELLLEQYDIR